MKCKVFRSVVAVAFVATAMFASPAAVTAQFPIVDYSLPAAWDGNLASPVLDQSGRGNDGVPSDAAGNGGPVSSATIPPGATAGTRSLDSTLGGGFITNKLNLLTNPRLEARGGFRLDAQIFWDGTDNVFGVQKIFDHEGTDGLQLQNANETAGTAELKFLFNDDNTGPSVIINANTWYDVSGIFDSLGNSIDGSGDLAGMATLIVDGASTSLAVTNTAFGDNFDRPLAIGTFSGFTGIVELNGLIYNPTVSFLQIPEPSSVALLGIGAVVLQMRRRRNG